MAEQKAPKQQKQKAAKKSYRSKGTGRSSMSTRGYSNKFISDMRHVKPGWTEAQREQLLAWQRSNPLRVEGHDA